MQKSRGVNHQPDRLSQHTDGCRGRGNRRVRRDLNQRFLSPGKSDSLVDPAIVLQTQTESRSYRPRIPDYDGTAVLWI